MPLYELTYEQAEHIALLAGRDPAVGKNDIRGAMSRPSLTPEDTTMVLLALDYTIDALGLSNRVRPEPSVTCIVGELRVIRTRLGG